MRRAVEQNNPKSPLHRGRDSEIDQGILPGLLGYQLRRAQVHMFQHFTANLGQFGVTPGQLGLLILLSRNPGISQTALARASGIERSTLGEVVGALEKRGLVERRRMEQDRRSHAVRLSPLGEETLAAILPLVDAHEQAAASRLTHEERSTLLGLLQRMS